MGDSGRRPNLVTLEIIAGILRIGPDCDGWLAPFKYSVPFVGDGGVAILKAANSPGCPIIRDRRAIMAKLAEYDFHTANYFHQNPAGEFVPRSVQLVRL